jgi:hypothetical protein
MLKLYINLDRSTGRRAYMEQRFPDFERYAGMNGRELSDDVLRNQRDTGVVHPESRLTRYEIACTMSHRAAIKSLLATNHSHLVLLEDDVRPVDNYASGCTFEWAAHCMGDNIDMLYLFAPHRPSHRPGSPCALDAQNRVKWSRSHMGVLYTRRGAEAALEAMRPIYYMHDTQIVSRIGLGCTKRVKFPDDMPELGRIEIKGLRNGIVEPSEHAAQTTMFEKSKKGIKLAKS